MALYRPSFSRCTLNHLHRRDGLHIREIDGDLVILDPEGQRMHSLNPTAAFIFEGLDGSRTIEDLAKEVAEGFGIDVERARADTEECLGRLRELGLLK